MIAKKNKRPELEDPDSYVFAAEIEHDGELDMQKVDKGVNGSQLDVTSKGDSPVN